MFVDEFTLPTLTIAAGESDYAQFDFTDDTGAALDATSWEMCVVDFVNPGEPVLQQQGSISTSVGSSATVTFNASATKDLRGKYIYMLKVSGANTVPICRKGIVYVTYAIGGDA